MYRLAVAGLAMMLAAQAAAAEEPFYRLQSAVTVAGPSPAWDYLSFDAAQRRLFMGRRKDGVFVYDVDSGKLVGKIDNAAGANVATLVPEFDRGYTTNNDGSTTIFALSTLKTLGRVKLGEDADAAFYDPASKQLAFMMGDSRAVAFVDAATGEPRGKLPMPSEKLEAAAPDGDGVLFIAERDRDAVAKVDMAKHALVAEWKIDDCREPTGLAYDRADQRIFAGCRGDKPVLAVLDARTGRTLQTLPLGRGNDGVVFDAETGRVFASNGVEGNLVVFDRQGPDQWRLTQAVTTRPMARTMALDPKTKTVFLVAAEGAVDPARPRNEEAGPFYPNRYFDDTFTVLTYAPR